jgi:predicted lipoprotein with Yx(FWY)xxD motif
MRNRWWAAPGAAAAVALLAACGSSGTSGASGGTSSTPAATSSSAPAASSSAPAATAASTSSTGITTAKSSIGTVLTTAQGFTIYWFAIDTPNKSNCSAQCAAFWPPLKGSPTMASGASLTGKFGTIKRADGTSQATYEGHPLYLFKEDLRPGQVNGNKLNTAGGLWWASTPTSAKLTTATKPAPTTSASSGSGGGSGGYGY